MTGQPPVYYARNRVYPGAYANTEWPTRVSHRIHDGFSLTDNYGLDTVSDDINSSPHSSPYYINGRFLSDNLVTQRGNSASVQGMKLLATWGDKKEDFADSDIQTSLRMWQGKQIKFEIPYNGKVVGTTISVKNTTACTGILSMYFSSIENGPVISEVAVDLCKVSTDFFEHLELRPAIVIPANANPRGKLYVRMEIWDEIDLKKRDENPFNTGRYIEIAADGRSDHYACEYRLGDKSMPVVEKYEYKRYPSCPLVGLIYNDYTSIPVDRIANEKVGASVSKDGYKYDLFAVKDSTSATLLVYDRSMGTLSDKASIKIDGRATEIQIAQVVQPGDQPLNYVYYVDGYSPLQRFKIGEWASEVVPANPATVTEEETGDTISCAPVIGASLMIHHNNRLYLGGFRKDPNLWQFSAIESTGPNYEAFPYRFYSPNNSPYANSTNPATAVVEVSSDRIMIVGKNSYSIFTTNVNIEALTTVAKDSSAYPQQVSTYADSAGVQSQGDICNYKGVVYSFDPKEGIRRYTGALWRVITNNVQSLFDRVDMDKPRKMWGYRNKLYFNYTDRIDKKAKCIVWDMGMNYQQYPWFQDVDIPFCDIRHDETEELVGIHPDYPCVMNLYAEDTWRRLDSPINFERHTKFLSVPGDANDMLVKRIHNKVIANSNRWWYFGIAFDQHEITQQRGKDIWYRMPSYDTVEIEEPPETPFPSQDIYEKDAVERISIMNLRIKCTAIQEKIKCRTFRAQASLVSTLFEVGPVQYI